MNDPNRSRQRGTRKTVRLAVRLFQCVYPHLTLILSVMFTVFWILDRFNPVMGFISGSMSKMLMIVFFVLVLLGSVIYIVTDAYGYRSGKTPAEKKTAKHKRDPPPKTGSVPGNDCLTY